MSRGPALQPCHEFLYLGQQASLRKPRTGIFCLSRSPQLSPDYCPKMSKRCSRYQQGQCVPVLSSIYTRSARCGPSRLESHSKHQATLFCQKMRGSGPWVRLHCQRQTSGLPWSGVTNVSLTTRSNSAFSLPYDGPTSQLGDSCGHYSRPAEMVTER